MWLSNGNDVRSVYNFRKILINYVLVQFVLYEHPMTNCIANWTKLLHNMYNVQEILREIEIFSFQAETFVKLLT